VFGRPAIDALLVKLKSAGGGMRNLLTLIVQSEVFAR